MWNANNDLVNYKIKQNINIGVKVLASLQIVWIYHNRESDINKCWNQEMFDIIFRFYE